MPLCTKCKEFFPPNYTEIVENSEPDGMTGQYPQHCIFCKLGVEHVERETSPNSGQFIKYTRNECLQDYKSFIEKMAKSAKSKEKIKDTLTGNPFGLEL
jgi:hypothetical protein